MHELPDAKQLFEVVATEMNLLPLIVEKDYWLMHCLWELQQQGYEFELKGGTSLSRGFGIIDRFSEDIDTLIKPSDKSAVKTGKNHDKPNHITSRKKYFDSLASEFKKDSFEFIRDHHFDDIKFRSAGIRAHYPSHFETQVSDEDSILKQGILLELGFDQTAPNTQCTISSWAFEKTQSLNISVMDNRPIAVKCYNPEYTFVEKLQTISTKFRQQQQQTNMPINFLRHYYDVYKLLEQKRVLSFIGSDDYHEHKLKRFRQNDEIIIKNNPAFMIKDKATKELYQKEFSKKSAMYFGEQPAFDDIMASIKLHIDSL